MTTTQRQAIQTVVQNIRGIIKNNVASQAYVSVMTDPHYKITAKQKEHLESTLSGLLVKLQGKPERRQVRRTQVKKKKQNITFKMTYQPGCHDALKTAK